MTEISFHFNVADRLEYACRLLRKASRQGAHVVVTAPAPVLTQLDRVLWTFDPIEFLPHVMPRPGQALPPRLAATRVWLLEDPGAAPYHDVLVNLGQEAAPSGFESFSRLIEIVTADETERASARGRWKHYAARGYAIERHSVVS